MGYGFPMGIIGTPWLEGLGMCLGPTGGCLKGTLFPPYI